MVVWLSLKTENSNQQQKPEQILHYYTLGRRRI
jgi:hypothetical protein